jgi:hypothetical protein
MIELPFKPKNKLNWLPGAFQSFNLFKYSKMTKLFLEALATKLTFKGFLSFQASFLFNFKLIERLIVILINIKYIFLDD